MKKIFSILLLTIIGLSNIQAKDVNINELVAKAKKENKQLMFFFHIPKCPYCARMLKKNFKDEKILNEIEKNLILTDIYTKDKGIITFNDFKGDRKAFAKYIGAVAYPATIFLDNDGKTIHKAIGYRNIGEYISEIKYVTTNSYKTKDLETFTEELEFAEDE
jgi:thioredoxin-related protein